MKILCVGDLHITGVSPKGRVDDFYSTLFNKLNFLFSNSDADVVIQAGDFFDHRMIPNYVLRKVFWMLGDYGFESTRYELPNAQGKRLFGVFGQHDLRYHKDKDNTALGVLAASGIITILTSEPIVIKDIHFYGASFEEPIPTPKDPKAKNILVMHRMTVIDKIWEGQTDFADAHRLLQMHPEYDLILCGDNHQNFQVGTKFGELLLNPGSLMRTRSDQFDHKPKAYLVDTGTKKIQVIQIPVLPFENVFNVEKVIATEELNEKLEAYINYMESMTTDPATGIDFTKILFDLANQLPKEEYILVNPILTELLDEVNSGGIQND